MDIATNGGWHVDCFLVSNNGTTAATFVNLYDVTALETGKYDVYFTWTDCHGYAHQTYKPAYSFLVNANGGGFGGCDTITDITSLQLTWAQIIPADCGVIIATHVPGGPYYVNCFDASVEWTTYNVNLYGVYAIWTSAQGPSLPDSGVYFEWTDCHGNTHESAPDIDIFIAPGDSSDGFGGCDYMKDLTVISIL